MAERHPEVEPAVLPAQVVAPEAVDRGLEVVDIPAGGPHHTRAHGGGKPKSRLFGGAVEACFGDVGDRVDGKAGNPVDHPDRLENASRDRGFDAGDGFRGARGRFDGRKTANRTIDHGVVGPFGEIGGLFDQIEHQIDEASYALHRASMNRLRGATQSAPLQP